MPSDSSISIELLQQSITRMGQQLVTRRTSTSARSEPSLTGASNQAMSSTMDPQAERDLTDAKIAAAEARTDTKLARMDGKLDLILSELQAARAEMQAVRADTKADNKDVRVDNSNNRNVIATVVIGTALGLAALIYALFSYGASQFYNGTVLRDLVHQEAAGSALPRSQPSQPKK